MKEMRMTDSILDNYRQLTAEIPSQVRLVVITKSRDASEIRMLYEAGHRVFGENRVQELQSKADALPPDIEWHMVGHLQTNKIKYIAPYVRMIHSVDSFKLLKAIDKEARKASRIIPCLLQVYIAEEETKFGFSRDEMEEMFRSEEFRQLENVSLCGLMGMATFTADMVQVRKEFRSLALLYRELKSSHFKDYDEFRELSMGMSGDYRVALEEGATMVRIGSIIFGPRCSV